MNDDTQKEIINWIEHMQFGIIKESEANILRDDWGAENLFEALRPYYEEVLLEPFGRIGDFAGLSICMTSEDKVRYYRRQNLKTLLLSDPFLPELIESTGLVRLLDLYLSLTKVSSTDRYIGFFRILSVSAVAKGYSTDWDELLAAMQQRTAAYKEAKDSEGVEYTAFVAALAHINLTKLRAQEKRRLCQLLLNHWFTLAYCLSITLDMRVSCGFDNVFQIVPQFASTQKRFAHLMLKCLARNPSSLSADKCDKQKRRIEALEKLVAVNNSTKLDHGLDELFRIIFPNVLFDEEVVMAKIQMIKACLKEGYTMQKTKNQQLFEEFRRRGELEESAKLVVVLREKLSKSVPAEALANTVLEKDPQAAEELFKQLDWGLSDTPAWAECREKVKAQIRMKRQAEEQRRETLTKGFEALQKLGETTSEGGAPINYFAAGSTHNDYSKHLTIGKDDNKQIEE